MKIKISKNKALLVTMVAALTVFLAGFIGFYTFIVPQLVNLGGFTTLAILTFGLAAGILSFFAPCSLAIFPGYIGYFVTETGASTRYEATKLGLIGAMGMVLFYGAAGLFISFIGGLSSVQSILKVSVPLMAVILFIVGYIFLKGETINMSFLTSIGGRIYSKKATRNNLFLFGFGYSLSSITCIFPVFLLLVIYPFLTGSFLNGVLAFVSFAVGKSIMFVLATVLVSESKSQLLTSKAEDFGQIKKASGFLLILVALYLTYYSLAVNGVIKPI